MRMRHSDQVGLMRVLLTLSFGFDDDDRAGDDDEDRLWRHGRDSTGRTSCLRVEMLPEPFSHTYNNSRWSFCARSGGTWWISARKKARVLKNDFCAYEKRRLITAPRVWWWFWHVRVKRSSEIVVEIRAFVCAWRRWWIGPKCKLLFQKRLLQIKLNHMRNKESICVWQSCYFHLWPNRSNVHAVNNTFMTNTKQHRINWSGRTLADLNLFFFSRLLIESKIGKKIHTHRYRTMADVYHYFFDVLFTCSAKRIMAEYICSCRDIRRENFVVFHSVRCHMKS